MRILTSPILEALPHLLHGFGMRSEEIPSGILFPEQVHGDHIEVIDNDVKESWHKKADAVMTSRPSLPLGVKTADCLPILMSDKGGRGVAAIHAGWKGVALGILPKAIRRFSMLFGAIPEEIYIAIGPSIGICCLEVDVPVRDFFVRQGYQSLWETYTRPGRPDHWWLDLKIIAQEQAIHEGVRAEHIDVLPYCTRCDADYFYSYRREGLAAGRQVNYIMLKESETEE